MPATWGFGAAGTEPIIMAGWGYLTDLEGTAVTDPILLHTTTATRRTHATTATQRDHALEATRRSHDITINEP